jgi:hypothetical protein
LRLPEFALTKWHIWITVKQGKGMIQLYLLSILFNGLIGFLLLAESPKGNGTIESSMKFSLNSGGFRLILGILATLTGVLKLFSPVMNRIYILGDFLPAIAGIAAGFILMFGFYREHSSKIEQDGQLDRIGDTFLRNRKAAGIALIIVSALHFLFPTALFL